MKHRSNTRGSAVVWAIATVGFLVIIITAFLTVSLRFAEGSISNAHQRQAYLTSRSAVDLVMQEFLDGTTNADEIYNYLLANGTWQVNSMNFPADMGTCSLTAVLTKGASAADGTTIRLTATAKANGYQQILSAVLKGVYVREGDPIPAEKPLALTWYLSVYEDGGGSVIE